MSKKTEAKLIIDPNEVCSQRHKGLFPDIELWVYWGIDGTPVAEIRTDNLKEDSTGPIMRIWLNDAAIYENPEVPESD